MADVDVKLSGACLKRTVFIPYCRWSILLSFSFMSQIGLATPFIYAVGEERLPKEDDKS